VTEPPAHLRVTVDPRGDGFHLRLSGRGPRVELETLTREHAANEVLTWLRATRQEGDVVEVHCGSRFVGSASEPTLVTALVLRALRVGE
jgi:hypothetical protein